MPNDKIRVLVVDDNENFTEILCDYIHLNNGNDIEVIGIARNGSAALEMITEKKPDMVILDIILPYLDGISVLKKVKEMNMKRKPLFIMLSAIGQNRIIQESLALDAVYYVEKPFDMDILISKIKQLRMSIILNKEFEN